MTEQRSSGGTGAAPPALRLEGVSKQFRSPGVSTLALLDVSLTVAPGELVAVMGPSGSGKSTIVQVACGLVTPDIGLVSVDGRLVMNDARAWARLRRQRIGVVLQRLNLVPALTSVENVMAPMLLDGARIRSARARALEAMAAVGVDHLAAVMPDQLSGGQQQRVAIARATVGDRGILLADEPTGALDSTTSDDVARLLAMRAEAGDAVLVVTHDAAVASWASRVVQLRDGSVVGPTPVGVRS